MATLHRRRCVGVLTLTAALTLGALPATAAEVCPPLDSGKVNTTGDPATVTVTAPDGFLIDGYCVKAGPGYLLVDVDPPQETVVIDHPTKDSVSHYSLSYTEVPPSSTTTTPPTTSSSSTTSTVPPTTAPPTSQPSTTTTVPSTPSTTSPATTTTAPITSSTSPPTSTTEQPEIGEPETTVTAPVEVDPPPSTVFVPTTGETPDRLPHTGMDHDDALRLAGGALAAGLILTGLTRRSQEVQP